MHLTFVRLLSLTVPVLRPYWRLCFSLSKQLRRLDAWRHRRGSGWRRYRNDKREWTNFLRCSSELDWTIISTRTSDKIRLCLQITNDTYLPPHLLLAYKVGSFLFSIHELLSSTLFKGGQHGITEPEDSTIASMDYSYTFVDERLISRECTSNSLTLTCLRSLLCRTSIFAHGRILGRSDEKVTVRRMVSISTTPLKSPYTTWKSIMAMIVSHSKSVFRPSPPAELISNLATAQRNGRVCIQYMV